mmetsp:Transcript_7007/g.43006  ORF Transcript_7007/g.43006 Transcript_7007/m.43006 type:complete len:290 (-) Transcript_7007:1232-2101(-)|eukprot:CAMPEP_0183826320 /NCGR_PEP_ID=MMETSP0807_2-20130328/1635_1 /TAXON_ID=88271 /ORGANISM="Picocystis salinarum, Strain CCMP1897" /LENGTH=289 /DNA_ID=CAMNT_0026071425 /DNA_START=72 /DNA_END=941 /DNA_ORIENTATION=-
MGSATSKQGGEGGGDGSGADVQKNDGKAVYDVYGRRIDSEAEGNESKCPVDHAKYRALGGLDPRNQMPKEPNQQPAPGQRVPLSVSRSWSTIPKSGTDGTWLYPSPQMFFNALQRKGKAEGVEEGDMDSVVYVHNTMNEATWQEVQRWEAMHKDTCREPKLQRFRGRPDDLTPRARFWKLLGYEPPFDRHDWYVDRCGEVVRYVIDFYFDESKAGSPDAFLLDVRPGLDSIGNTMDRIRMTMREAAGSLQGNTEENQPVPATQTEAPGRAQMQAAKPSSCPMSSQSRVN